MWINGELQDWIKQSSGGHFHIKLQLHFLIGKVFLFLFKISIKKLADLHLQYICCIVVSQRGCLHQHWVNAKVLQYKKKTHKVTCMIGLEQTNWVFKVLLLKLENYSSLDQRSVKEAAIMKHLLRVCCYNIKALVSEATSEETIPNKFTFLVSKSLLHSMNSKQSVVFKRKWEIFINNPPVQQSHIYYQSLHLNTKMRSLEFQ